MPTQDNRIKAQIDDGRGGKRDVLIDLAANRMYSADGRDTLLKDIKPGNNRHGMSETQLLMLSQWTAEEGKRQTFSRVRSAGSDDRIDQAYLMDLSPDQVHIPSAVPDRAYGYKLADGAADIVAPIWNVTKASDFYNVWSSDDAFQMADFSEAAAGAGVQEINPRVSATQFNTIARAWGGFIDTETQANADSPLQPGQKVVRRCMRVATLAREYRVQKKIRTSANWGSAMVNALDSAHAWGLLSGGAGANSDPLADMQNAELNSYMPITRWIVSTQGVYAFLRNPQVRAYVFAKMNLGAMPSLNEVSNTFGIAPITEVRMKYKTSNTAGAALTYMWGGDVVGIHEPEQNPPQDQEDIATMYTARWNGGITPDGTFNGGYLIRSFFDERRGPRGGNMTILVHQDAEIMTSNLVGALITGAVQ